MGKYDLLREKVERDGGTVQHMTFDAGSAITVKYPDMAVKMFSAYWGDEKDAVDLASEWVGGLKDANR